MFQVREDEFKALMSQFATSNEGQRRWVMAVVANYRWCLLSTVRCRPRPCSTKFPCGRGFAIRRFKHSFNCAARLRRTSNWLSSWPSWISAYLQSLDARSGDYRNSQYASCIDATTRVRRRNDQSDLLCRRMGVGRIREAKRTGRQNSHNKKFTVGARQSCGRCSANPHQIAEAISS